MAQDGLVIEGWAFAKSRQVRLGSQPVYVSLKLVPLAHKIAGLPFRG